MEELRDSDRRHRELEARRLREAPDEHDLDQRTQPDGGGQPDRRREPEVQPLADEQRREDGHRATDVELGEVDDPVGAVDEHQPDGDQARQ